MICKLTLSVGVFLVGSDHWFLSHLCSLSWFVHVVPFSVLNLCLSVSSSVPEPCIALALGLSVAGTNHDIEQKHTIQPHM